MSEQKQSLRRSMITGSIWMVSMRWAIRGIGFVSTIILARLLVPEDFGLVAMGMLVVTFLDILTGFGVDLALIQRQDATRDHYDSAWTLRIFQTVVVGIVVVIVAPFAAEYFNEPRVTNLMMVLAVAVAISGFENIGTVAFRKDLDFAKEFRYRVIVKLGAFFVTMVLAFWWRNYWALVCGIITARFLTILLSYLFHPYRPKFKISKFPDLWGFSQWMLLRNIGMYIRKQIDAFMVGKYFSTADMGLYRMSNEVAQMPTTELVWPMARALFPGYAKLAHNPDWLGKTYLKVLSTITLITVPLGLGLAFTADPLVRILLGEKWLHVIPILPWLALSSIILTLSASVQNVLMALGRMKRLVAIVWFQALIAIPVIVYVASKGTLIQVAQAQVVISALALPVFFYSLVSLSVIDWLGITRAIWRPIVAGIVMSVSLVALKGLNIDSMLLNLFVFVSVGAIIFIITEFFSWKVSGRPDGGEKLFAEILSKKLPWFKKYLSD